MRNETGRLAVVRNRVILKVPGRGDHLILCYIVPRELPQKEVGAVVEWYIEVHYCLDPEEWQE